MHRLMQGDKGVGEKITDGQGPNYEDFVYCEKDNGTLQGVKATEESWSNKQHEYI